MLTLNVEKVNVTFKNANNRYLQSLDGVEVAAAPALPLFHTAIDHVPLDVNVCGVKFDNPFGLASAPPTTSAAMIRRAFEQGWSFAVTKTFTTDEVFALE